MNEAKIVTGPTDKSEDIELRIAVEKNHYIDRIVDQFSDWCSPILVKETRQALKSRQFFWTFFLLLAAIALWTMIGLTFNDARVDFGNAGPNLLSGYWIILGFPLSIVIPFGAYRSLAREYEDGTIQLVSVTTMRAWQIVAGKLGSSMLQMLIYLSIIAPCIAFTYLLRGLSLPQISAGIVICICGCVCLSCVALFFAGSTRSRIYGVGVSIVLIVIQIGVFIAWIIFSVALASGELSFLEIDGQFVFSGIVMAILSTAALMFAAAASMISFESDNRSSIVRVMMLVQQTLFIAWCLTLACFVLDEEMLLALTFVSTHYWLAMGFLLVSENDELSARVRRQIPKTWFGRITCSWFLPGAGRGLVFATGNIWFCAFTFFLMIWAGQWLPQANSNNFNMTSYRFTPSANDFVPHIVSLISICLYSSFYLALTYLICQRYRRTGRVVTGLFSFAAGTVMIFLVTGGSLLFHFNLLPSRNWDMYTADQIFNWYWTSTELFEGGASNVDPVLAFLAGMIMLGICVLAWATAARELNQTRAVVPEKVEFEMAEEKKVERIPEGETIDEIFGELPKNESE